MIVGQIFRLISLHGEHAHHVLVLEFFGVGAETFLAIFALIITDKN